MDENQNRAHLFANRVLHGVNDDHEFPIYLFLNALSNPF